MPLAGGPARLEPRRPAAGLPGHQCVGWAGLGDAGEVVLAGDVDVVGSEAVGDIDGVVGMEVLGDVDGVDVLGDVDGAGVVAPIRPGSGVRPAGTAAKPSVFPALSV